MRVISPRSAGNTYLPPSGTYRSSLSSTTSDRGNYKTSDYSSTYTGRSYLTLNRTVSNDPTTTSSRYGLSSNKFSRSSADRDLPPTSGSRYNRSESRNRDHQSSTLGGGGSSSGSAALRLATTCADLYEKYSPANYIPKCELSRSRSLTEAQKLVKEKTPVSETSASVTSTLSKVKQCVAHSTSINNNNNNINLNININNTNKTNVTNNQAFGLKKYTDACIAKTNAATSFIDSRKLRSNTDAVSTHRMTLNNDQFNSQSYIRVLNSFDMKATNDISNYGGHYKDFLKTETETVRNELNSKVKEINNNSNNVNKVISTKFSNNNLSSNGISKNGSIKMLVPTKPLTFIKPRSTNIEPIKGNNKKPITELEEVTNKVLNSKLKCLTKLREPLLDDIKPIPHNDINDRTKSTILSATPIINFPSTVEKSPKKLLDGHRAKSNNKLKLNVTNVSTINEIEKNEIVECEDKEIENKIISENDIDLKNNDAESTSYALKTNVIPVEWSNSKVEKDSDDECYRNASNRTTLPPTGAPAVGKYRERPSFGRSSLSDADSFTLSKSPYTTSSSSIADSTESAEGLCGLRNIGNTCFMNSVLQCLSHTNELTKFVRNQYAPKTTTKDQRIFSEFVKLVKEMWTTSTRSVTPMELKCAISNKYRMYSGSAQQDAQEFLRFFLDTLHSALNTGGKGEHLEIDDNLSDTRKADLTWEWYSRVENSLIKDLFVGQLKSSLRCTVCGNTSVTFDPFWDLSVPLPSSTRCKLENCLELFIKEEILDGDEMPTCSKCQTRRKSTKTFTIQRFPKYLVIHLKRFSETRWSKLTNIVEFPTGERGLDMSPYASSTNSSPSTYTLYGISNHMGSTAGGHYVAVCKHPNSRKWHEFNDNIVSDSSECNLISSSAYLLFYERS